MLFNDSMITNTCVHMHSACCAVYLIVYSFGIIFCLLPVVWEPQQTECLYPLLCSSYAYDTSGAHLMTVTVSDQSAIYSYNEEGDLIEVVEATQERKRFSYDDRGLLVDSAVYSDSDNLVSSVTITYEWNGLVAMSLQPENKTFATYIDSEGSPKLFSSSPHSPPIVQIDLPASNGRKLIVGDQVSFVFAVFQKGHYVVAFCLTGSF